MFITDYALTGNTYKRLNAYVHALGVHQIDALCADWDFFGETIHFKSCKRFVKFLECKHPGYRFKACIAN
jgi:hypothetical protein